MNRFLAWTLPGLISASILPCRERFVPECERVREDRLLDLSPPQLRAGGLPRVAADIEAAEKMLTAAQNYVACMEALGGDYARSLGEKGSDPPRNPDGTFPRPDSDPCLPQVIDALVRIMKADPEIPDLRASHPLNLIIGRFEPWGEVCWTRSYTIVSTRDEPDKMHYSPCDYSSRLEAYRKVGELRVRFEVHREHDGYGLEEGTWECPDSGRYVEIVGGEYGAPEGVCPIETHRSGNPKE